MLNLVRFALGMRFAGFENVFLQRKHDQARISIVISELCLKFLKNR